LYFTCALVLVSLGILKSFNGPHGGVVKKAGNYSIESKNLPASFCAWLLDKKSNALSNKNVTCKVRFIYADSSNVDAELIKMGSDGFTTTTSFQGYTICRVTFNIGNEDVSAKFENETALVSKDKR
jgi:hypothetical protein